MTTTTNTASPALAQEYSLSQAAYHALVKGFDTVMKFEPTAIVVKDSVLFTPVAGGKAVIQADYAALIGQPVTMAFVADKVAIRKMKAICEASDVRVSLADGRYEIEGEPTATDLEAIAIPKPDTFRLPVVTWIGAELSGYDPKNLQMFIGKKSDAVHLAIYGGQFEQIRVEGWNKPYTFTAGMAGRLAGLRPDVELLSHVAFRHFGKKQSLHIGQFNGDYILKVISPLDIKTDLVVIEQLEVVAA